MKKIAISSVSILFQSLKNGKTNVITMVISKEIISKYFHWDIKFDPLPTENRIKLDYNQYIY